MHVLVVLILASLSVATAFLLAFWWAVRSGQFDDTYTPSMRILFEDQTPNERNERMHISTREKE